ncbi:MAG: hypothetical protein ABEJ56_03035 [Candidatus Nanohaloarchaea archaeon]
MKRPNFRDFETELQALAEQVKQQKPATKIAEEASPQSVLVLE